MDKFCPFRSINATEPVLCYKDCALYADNDECALLNIGNHFAENNEETDEQNEN